MFSLKNNGLVHIQFKNKLTISILIGAGSYSDNHYNLELFDILFNPEKILRYKGNDVKEWNTFEYQCKNCEIAVFGESGGFITQEIFENADDDVIGYIEMDELIDMIHKVKNYKYI